MRNFQFLLYTGIWIGDLLDGWGEEYRGYWIWLNLILETWIESSKPDKFEINVNMVHAQFFQNLFGALRFDSLSMPCCKSKDSEIRRDSYFNKTAFNIPLATLLHSIMYVQQQVVVWKALHVRGMSNIIQDSMDYKRVRIEEKCMEDFICVINVAYVFRWKLYLESFNSYRSSPIYHCIAWHSHTYCRYMNL